jgi:DNA excision repair protein ERCC-6
MSSPNHPIELDLVAEDDLGTRTPSNLVDPANESDRVDGKDDGDGTIEGDEAAQLAALGAGIADQEELERNVGQQANQALLEQAEERDRKRLEKTQKEKDRMTVALTLAERNLAKPAGSATKNKYRAEIEHYKALIKNLDIDLEQIQKRMVERQNDAAEANGETLLEEGSNKRQPGESHREFLIRTGKITPFSKMGRSLLKASSSLGDVLADAEEEDEEEDDDEEEEGGRLPEDDSVGPKSHQYLLAPGFEDEDERPMPNGSEVEDDEAMARRLQEEEFASERPAKRRRLQSNRQQKVTSAEPETADDSDMYVPNVDDDGLAAIGRSGDEEEPEDDEGDFPLASTPGIKRKQKGKQKAVEKDAEQEDLAGIDDGNEGVYQARLQSWVKRRSAARERHQREATPTEQNGETKDENDVEEDKPEWQKPHPTRIDAEFEGGYRIPGDIYPSLFDYQKTGVQWLWELYSQQVGGIIGDEMGLGKTIQTISFLAGLHYSGKVTKPIIVICPATVMKQWVNEFHRWWPPLRVSILHSSGSGMLDLKRESRFEEDLEDDEYKRKKTQGKSGGAVRRIVDRVVQDGHVLVTTYSGLQTYADHLIPIDWEYCVLDEGHKIRNPNTAITIFCKEIRTHNRVILSGTPMQNNLTELWSLFDFVFPMRLGTLVNFKNQFEIPIKHGGYANASNLQVETAMKCAETLKDAIAPYLLQRFKVDVAADLPKKTERVLFCKLTKLQRDAYQWFLESEDMKSILNGKRQALYGVDILRKLCNHPDLVEHRTLSKKAGYNYGDGKKSGKMQVVKALLEIWKRGGHKTLLFAQHKIVLDILEKFIRAMPGFNFLRMDGGTDIKNRQDLVDKFNNDPELHVFLLTTKVGGLGVNLTGADRVIIYDPDWNPSTDVQARERAWRLGQKREVEIYRLMTAGTIEEKIYHRQLFKQFLTNKILRDPKQRQTFQLRDLHDLFTLGESKDGQTETGSIFQGTEVKLQSEPPNGTQPTASADAAQQQQQKASEHAAMHDVAGISRQEDWQGSGDDPTKPAGAGGEPTDRMLSSIFARTGVQGAQDHDAIINNNNGRKTAPRADPDMIAREAKKVAAEAARELQRSAAIARDLPAGVPTWTGQVGSAGRPPSPPPRRGGGARGRGRGGGPSSLAVLANLQHRVGNAANTPTASASPAPASSSSRVRPPPPLRGADRPQGVDFMKLIRDYLVAHGGAAYSQMLVDHFDHLCRGSQERGVQFAEMLKKIATLNKGGRMRGKWVLKEEYK